MDPPSEGTPQRAKRVHRLSSAMRESLESAKSYKSAMVEEGRSNSRKSTKTDPEGTRSGGSAGAPSKSKGSHSKSSGGNSQPTQTPPNSARANRNTTVNPSPVAPPPAAPMPPPTATVPQPTERLPPPVQWWITSPNVPAGSSVYFYPAFAPTTLAPSAYSYSLPQNVPLPPPTTNENPSAMDVTPSPTEPPQPNASAASIPYLGPKTPLTKLQQQYHSSVALKQGNAMNPTAQISVPAYTASQIRQVQHHSMTHSEVGSLNFVPHIKKPTSEPSTLASQGRVFIIDNGAYAVKMGFSTNNNPDIIHNMIGKPKAAKRKYVGAELGTVHGAYTSNAKASLVSPSSVSSATAGSKVDHSVCSDFRALSITRPHDRGYVLNWDLQAQIWALHEVFRRKFPVATTKKTTSSQHLAQTSTDPCDIQEASSHCLILTEAHLAPWKLRQKLFEWVYGSAKFGSLFVCSSAYLSMMQHRYMQVYTAGMGRVLGDAGEHESLDALPKPAQSACCLVVDVGYSFTHVTPFFEEAKLNYAIRRLNVGGKVMTNLLRELVSFRHFNMMDQTYLMSLVKERVCYVSTDFQGDLKKSRLKKNAIRRHYVLPDQANSILGYVYGTQPTPEDLGRANEAGKEQNSKTMDVSQPSASSSSDGGQQQKQLPLPEDAQVLTLGNERFSVPEVLFHPSDVGLRQAGLGEVIVQSISACPEYLREALCANIVLVGGSAAIPGLPERLLQEIRPLLPASFAIRIFISNNPGNSAWLGGKYLAVHRPDLLDSMAVSLQEYQEQGPNLPKHKFALF